MINLSKVLKFVVPVASGAIGGFLSILQMNQLKEEVTKEVTLNVIDTLEEDMNLTKKENEEN